MGNCASFDTSLDALEEGDVLWGGKRSPGELGDFFATCNPSQFYICKTGALVRENAIFSRCGVVYRSSSGELTVLVSPTCGGFKNIADFQALVGTKPAAISVTKLQPPLRSREIEMLTTFAENASSELGSDKRVTLHVSWGHKVFVSQMVAEALVAAGRVMRHDNCYGPCAKADCGLSFSPLSPVVRPLAATRSSSSTISSSSCSSEGGCGGTTARSSPTQQPAAAPQHGERGLCAVVASSQQVKGNSTRGQSCQGDTTSTASPAAASGLGVAAASPGATSGHGPQATNVQPAAVATISPPQHDSGQLPLTPMGCTGGAVGALFTCSRSSMPSSAAASTSKGGQAAAAPTASGVPTRSSPVSPLPLSSSANGSLPTRGSPAAASPASPGARASPPPQPAVTHGWLSRLPDPQPGSAPLPVPLPLQRPSGEQKSSPPQSTSLISLIFSSTGGRASANAPCPTASSSAMGPGSGRTLHSRHASGLLSVNAAAAAVALLGSAVAPLAAGAGRHSRNASGPLQSVSSSAGQEVLSGDQVASSSSRPPSGPASAPSPESSPPAATSEPPKSSMPVRRGALKTTSLRSPGSVPLAPVSALRKTMSVKPGGARVRWADAGEGASRADNGGTALSTERSPRARNAAAAEVNEAELDAVTQLQQQQQQQQSADGQGIPIAGVPAPRDTAPLAAQQAPARASDSEWPAFSALSDPSNSASTSTAASQMPRRHTTDAWRTGQQRARYDDGSYGGAATASDGEGATAADATSAGSSSWSYRRLLCPKPECPITAAWRLGGMVSLHNLFSLSVPTSLLHGGGRPAVPSISVALEGQ